MTAPIKPEYVPVPYDEVMETINGREWLSCAYDDIIITVVEDRPRENQPDRTAVVAHNRTNSRGIMFTVNHERVAELYGGSGLRDCVDAGYQIWLKHKDELPAEGFVGLYIN